MSCWSAAAACGSMAGMLLVAEAPHRACLEHSAFQPPAGQCLQDNAYISLVVLQPAICQPGKDSVWLWRQPAGLWDMMPPSHLLASGCTQKIWFASLAVLQPAACQPDWVGGDQPAGMHQPADILFASLLAGLQSLPDPPLPASSILAAGKLSLTCQAAAVEEADLPAGCSCSLMAWAQPTGRG